MRAVDRARRDGDKKFIAIDDVYRRLKGGEIDKINALRLLGDAGVNGKNLMELWCRGLKL